MLEFGSRIAEDIGAEEHLNVTGQWIAHHLAEKIEAAKTDPTLESECVDLILKLWSSRGDFPQGDPFERYEKLLDRLERYFSDGSRIIVPPRPEDPPENELIDIASEIDTNSRYLVKAILVEALRRTGMEDDKLLRMATEIVSDQLTRYNLLKAVRIPSMREEDESEESPVKEETPSGELGENETDYSDLPDDIARTMRELGEAMRRYRKMRASPKAD